MATPSPAGEPPLTPTSFVVLGLVARSGPLTPYAMKQQVAGSVGYLWAFPHTQLYTEPARLAGLGLLSEEQEEGGRRRRTYAITDAGRAALARWLAQPDPEQTEIRDLALLKLFFGGLADPAEVAALARAQVAAHAGRLAVYTELDAALVTADDQHPRATVHLGMAYEQAAVAFWQAVADEPPATGAARPPAT